MDSSIDVCFLTETWLRKGDASKIAEIKDYSYNLCHQSRRGKGGGVAIAFKKHIKITRSRRKTYKSFELIECLAKSSSNELLRLCCVYRSCTASLSNVNDFCKDFDDFLCDLILQPGKPMIAGDFNIHVENDHDPDAKKFFSVLSKYNFVQHIDCVTHQAGGTLDLVLTRDCSPDNLSLTEISIDKAWTQSDHYLVNFNCEFSLITGPNKVKVMARKLHKIDMSAFKADLMSSPINDPTMYRDCNKAMEMYNDELKRILNTHAPELEFWTNPDQSDWINTACQDARRSRRKAERDYKRLKSPRAKDIFRRACKITESVLNTTRDSFYKNRLQACADNKKQTYNIVNKLMDRNVTSKTVPSERPGVAQEMQTFFKDKVERIYSDIENDLIKDLPLPSCNPTIENSPVNKWNDFVSLTPSDIKSVIKDLNKKECELDPIPVKLLLECIDEVSPIITFIVNDSLSKGIFPDLLKSALVRPAIKDEAGDINDFQNYRPISNLPFMSKIVEKCVQLQLVKHLDVNGLHAPHQSGYRENHSCETATLTVYNDLLCVSDVETKVILLLLDLSAAFDTVNHSILLTKLENNFGLTGTTLKWFTSYLEGRSFTVTVNQARSKECFFRIGVPQGSILGPILFILYTKDLELIAKKHGFSIHLYADDTQLYLEFNPLNEHVSALEVRIVNCLTDIKAWMTDNRLKLNQNKTEILTVQSRNNFSSWSVDKLKIGQAEELPTSPVVKSLGVLFDSHLTFEDHINKTIQTCNIHLRNLRLIASKLDFHLKRQLIHCLIFSKLDYCNGLFYGLPDYQIKKLQKVQNACTRFLFNKYNYAGKFESISPYLKEAHFLPIKFRIIFKIALTVFKCVNNISPEYLKNCVKIKEQPSRSLRTEDDFFVLDIPPVPRLKRTERALSFCGPSIWNKLPYHLRACENISRFKKDLKTYLFTKAFESF